MTKDSAFIFSYPTFTIIHRGLSLLSITLNAEVIALICAEDLMKIIVGDVINFEEMVGIDHALETIKNVLSERQHELGENATFETIQSCIYSMTNYILEHLPKDLNDSIDEMITRGMSAGMIKLQPDNKELQRASRRIIKERSKDKISEIVITLGLKEEARGGSKGKWNKKRRSEFLALYESTLEKVRNRSQDLPHAIRQRLSLRGEKPSEVARDYSAELFGVEPNTYLDSVLKQARKERKGTGQ